MSTELLLVRHGETEGESSIRYHGRNDVALSELGRAQMRAVAAALASKRFARVFASTLSRAAEGARLIAGESASIVCIEEFAEVDFGLFEGLTSDEIRSRYPDEFERWSRAGLDTSYTYPGGESRAAFRARVERGLGRILQMWDEGEAPADGPALVVAHRGVIRTIVRSLVGVEPVIDLASINILERAGQWRVRDLDIISHLEGLDLRAGGS